MAQLPINYGAAANDGTGTNWRTAFQRIQDNFTDLYSVQSRTVNVGDVRFDGAATTEARVQAAIDQAVLELATIVLVPAQFIPYDGTLVTFNDDIRMVREGGNWNTYDARAYGVAGWDVGSGRAPAEYATIAQGWMAGGVEIIAHRGHSHVAPEATLAAFSAAGGVAHSVEFDVHFSSDGVPVVCHDPTVDRTSDGSGNIKDKTIAQLEALDFGLWFDARFTGTKIPRFRNALKSVSHWARLIYPEIKGYRTQDDVLLFTQEIVDLGLEDRCIIQSFEPTDYPLVRAVSTRITLGYVVDDITAFDAQLPLAAADGSAVMIAEQQVLLDNPTRVATARSYGVDVVAWTVDVWTQAERLIDLGVRRIMCNTPGIGVVAR